MSMDFFNAISVKEALQIITKLANDYKMDTEVVSLVDAIDRIVAMNYRAPVNLPQFNRSTVDGYAVMIQDVVDASETSPMPLKLVHEVIMGEVVTDVLKEGQTVYVPTGGMLPEKTEGMVMIEYTKQLDEETILIKKPVQEGENISYTGDDLSLGEVYIKAGKRITAYDLGLFASMGVGQIEVYKKPVFSIISTGDEIIGIDEEQSFGQIREINSYALGGLIKQLGGEVNKRKIVKDDFGKIRSALEETLVLSDIILVSGGSSVGKKDYTRQVIESFDNSQIWVHGIAIKPGRPTIFGQVEGKLVVGLPGHPASALVTFSLFVKRYFLTIQKSRQEVVHIKAMLTGDVYAAQGRETYQMVRLSRKADIWEALPLYGKSGMMTLLAKASGYIKIPFEKEKFEKGTFVDVYLLKDLTL
ncbi:MAG: molybdopterin molybdenumtransferase MoeA [Firmicutes bacterium HGW-Firmicutes-5]|nr:MAG: molybdopterin molybdenumtransferase MoeA [Firmicutes bacterium HGW-Firmicutes-5]